MNLLVTGGAGFIGTNFVHHWISRYPLDRIINLDALTYAGNLQNLIEINDHPNYRFVKGDIRDADLLQLIFETELIDVVVHFAGETHVDRSISGPQPFIDTNVTGTLMLLEVARQNWKNNDDHRFVHISTDEVYGSLKPSDPPFTEESSYRPNSPYAASKAASDHLVRSYQKTFDLPTVTAHASNNYGPFQFPEKLIPLMILNILDRKPLPIYGTGENIRDWIYVEDFCRAIEKIIFDRETGETYNVSGNCEMQNIDLVKMLCDLVDRKTGSKNSRELIQFVSDRPGHDQRYSMATAKIRQTLGWQTIESFESGINKTIDWYLGNREWWEQIRSGEYQTYYQMQYSDLF